MGEGREAAKRAYQLEKKWHEVACRRVGKRMTSQQRSKKGCAKKKAKAVERLEM